MEGDGEFREFVLASEPRLRRALIAVHGKERGREATAEALAYAWEHWARIVTMRNPVGYLFRVGQSRTRIRRRRPVFARAEHNESSFEPALSDALAQLSERQRVAVVLVHGFGWTLREVAELMGVALPTVQKHAERGLRHLRLAIGADDGAT